MLFEDERAASRLKAMRSGTCGLRVRERNTQSMRNTGDTTFLLRAELTKNKVSNSNRNARVIVEPSLESSFNISLGFAFEELKVHVVLEHKPQMHRGRKRWKRRRRVHKTATASEVLEGARRPVEITAVVHRGVQVSGGALCVAEPNMLGAYEKALTARMAVQLKLVPGRGGAWPGVWRTTRTSSSGPLPCTYRTRC